MASKYPHIVPGAQVVINDSTHHLYNKVFTVHETPHGNPQYVNLFTPGEEGIFPFRKINLDAAVVAPETTEEEAPEVITPTAKPADTEVQDTAAPEPVVVAVTGEVVPAATKRGGLKPSTLTLVEQRRPSWSTLATQFDHGVTAREALEQAGLEDMIVKAPMFVQLADGDFIEVKDKFAMVNPRTGKFYGPASKEYTFLQNEEVAAMLDAYITSEFPVIGAGNTPDGAGIMFVLDAGERIVAGEQIKQYFIVAESRSVGISFRSAFTPLRPICQNTLMTSFSKAFVAMSARHDRNIKVSIADSMNFVNHARIQARHTMELMDLMATVQIRPDELLRMVELAFPFPGRDNLDGLLQAFGETPEQEYAQTKLGKAQKAYNYWSARAQAMRDMAVAQFENFGTQTGNPDLLGTVYSAYQAVVEVADHGIFKGSNLPTVAGDSLYGVRADGKIRAMDFAGGLVRASR